MLWTGPWDLSSINTRRHYGVTLPARLQRQPRDDLGPGPVHAVRPLVRPGCDTAFKFVDWLTSAEGAPAVRDRDRRPAVAQVRDDAARLQDVPGEVPGREGLRRQPQQRQARPSEHPRRTRRCPRRSGRWCSRCCSARPQPADALKSGSERGDGGPGRLVTPGRWLPGRAPSVPRRSCRAAAAGRARPRRRRGRRRRADALDRLGDDHAERRADRPVRAGPGRVGVRAVVPAQRPADAGDVGRARQLPQLVHDPVFLESVRHTLVYTVLFVPITLVLSLLAAAALNRRIRGITVYRLAVFIPVVTSTIATGVIFTWLMDPDFGLINAGAAQARPADLRVLRRSEPGAVRRRDHDGVGLGRLRRADLPRRPAGHPAGPHRGGADRRLLEARRVLAHPGAAAAPGHRLPAGLADDQLAAAVRRGVRDDQGRSAALDDGDRLLPLPAGVPVLPRRLRRRDRRRAVRRDRS